MRLKRPVAALALAGLLVLAGCTSLAAAPESTPESTPSPEEMSVKLVEENANDQASIVVSGSHSIEAAPDTAQIRLNIVASGADAETVRNHLADDAQALRRGLVTDGPLEEDQLRSDRFRIREDRRAQREPEVEPYRGYHRFVVTLDDVDAVEPTIDTAVEVAHVEVNHVEFGLSDDRRAELRDEALEQAMANARAEAELLASTEALSVGPPETIVTDRVTVRPSRSPVVMEAGQAAGTPTAAPRTTIDEDDVTVSVSVHVTYIAEDARS